MSVETLKQRRLQLNAPRRAPAAVGRMSGSAGRPLGQDNVATRVLPTMVVVFLISIFVPWQIDIGVIRLSTSRFTLLLLLPLLVRLLFLGAGKRIILSDIAFFGLCFWIAVCMNYNHGLNVTYEYVGIYTIETLGAYLLGRCLITNAQQFYALARALFILVCCLFPFALFEAVTGVNILLQIANAIINSQPEATGLGRRLGLDRVQLTLDHPIHMGVIVGAMVPIVHCTLGYGRPMFKRLQKSGLVGLVAFFSLSSGAVIMMGIQVMLLTWERMMSRLRERWQVLLCFLAVMAVFEYFTGFFLDFVVNVLAFDSNTATNRLRIFEWGMKNVEANPIYGIGLNEWVHLPGTTASVDMFWMLITMMFGYPGGFLNIFGFVWIVVSLLSREMPNERIRAYKLGYLVSMVGLFLALWTVHVWREAYVFIWFLLGSGAWMLFEQPPEERKAKTGRRVIGETHKPHMTLAERRRGRRTDRSGDQPENVTRLR